MMGTGVLGYRFTGNRRSWFVLIHIVSSFPSGILCDAEFPGYLPYCVVAEVHFFGYFSGIEAFSCPEHDGGDVISCFIGNPVPGFLLFIDSVVNGLARHAVHSCNLALGETGVQEGEDNVFIWHFFYSKYVISLT